MFLKAKGGWLHTFKAATEKLLSLKLELGLPSISLLFQSSRLAVLIDFNSVM